MQPRFQIGLSTGRSESGLCPTRNQLGYFGSTIFRPITDRWKGSVRVVGPPRRPVGSQSGLKVAKLCRNLLKSTGPVPNRLDMLRSSQILMRSRLISTRSSRISMRSCQISKRSGHFLTNRTKTIGEMLPSMENEDFFRCNTVGSVFFQVFMFRSVNRPAGLGYWRRRPATGPSSASGWLILELAKLVGWVGWRVGLDTPTSKQSAHNHITWKIR